MAVFKDYSKYYNLLYKDKNYRSEVDYVERLIRSYNPGTKIILNLGCGTGNHDLILANRNYEIVGVDLSGDMVAIANEEKAVRQHLKLKFLQGDIRKLDLATQFDAVLSLFHVISYQTENSDLENAFTSAFRHLKKGGVFIFDCWYGPGVLTDRPAIRDRMLEDQEFKVRRLSTPTIHINENCVDVEFKVKILNKLSCESYDIEEMHKMRYLFLPELKFLLNKVGFTFQTAEEWLTGAKLTERSWNATIVCTK